MSKLRHFLDLTEVPTSELRAIIDNSIAMKKKRKANVAEGKLLL